MNPTIFPCAGLQLCPGKLSYRTNPSANQKKTRAGEEAFDRWPFPGANASCCRDLGDLGKATNSMMSPLSAMEQTLGKQVDNTCVTAATTQGPCGWFQGQTQNPNRFILSQQ